MRNLPLLIATSIITAIFMVCLYMVLKDTPAIFSVGLIFTSFAFGYIVRDDLTE
jgi:hypothetical protein